VPPDPDDAASLLDELFPPKASDKESLIPDLGRRGLETKPAIPYSWVFLVGSVCGVAVFFQCEAWESDQFIRSLLYGVGAGLYGGGFLVCLSYLGECFIWGIHHWFRPGDQRLRAAIEQTPEEDEEGGPFPAWGPEEMSQPDTTTGAIDEPSPAPPSTSFTHKESPDAFHPPP
jgi:hypothetical protein